MLAHARPPRIILLLDNWGQCDPNSSNDFIAELGLPRQLSEVGIGPEHFPTIATNAMHDRWLHKNPVKITSPEQVLKILEAAA
ncbi:MAG: iron-containing alcohol dehydrogenase [Betaproteobacteria bacterium]|nr:iron-containing alcohol dehydrogenase [Betaproteobacteria bacterium]